MRSRCVHHLLLAIVDISYYIRMMVTRLASTVGHQAGVRGVIWLTTLHSCATPASRLAGSCCSAGTVKIVQPICA